jgi:hypothetical protein
MEIGFRIQPMDKHDNGCYEDCDNRARKGEIAQQFEHVARRPVMFQRTAKLVAMN